MKKYGVGFILFAIFLLLILPRLIFPEGNEVDSTGLVNTIRFTALALIIAAIGIKLAFKK